MFQFNTIDGKFYSIPEALITNLSGYFKLIKSGDVIQLTSTQIDYLLFGLDQFDLEEFAKSVPIIFQFSNIDFDKKVLMKLKTIFEEQEKNKLLKLYGNMYDLEDYKLEIRNEEDIEYLRNGIESELSENPSFEELKRIFILYSMANLNIGKHFIKRNFGNLNTVEEKIKYFKTIKIFDINILKCLGYYGNYAAYFKDDFCIHLIDNTNSRQCENFLDYLFSYASFNSIKYLLETKGNDLCDVRIFDSMFNSKTLFSYACRRNLEELIVYLIDKKVNLLNIDSDGNSAAHLICKYSTPEMLKYLLQNTNIIFGKNFSMCGPDFYMENNYLMQNFIVQNNFQYTNLDTIKLLMKW